MAYQLKAITIRTNNSPEGMKKIEDHWKELNNIHPEANRIKQPVSFPGKRL